jgi:CRISPR system Cascade subunit CasE
MYLTRFEINRARRGARKLLGSPQAMHAAVSRSFPWNEPADGHDPFDTAKEPAPVPEPGPVPVPSGTPRTLWRVDDDGQRAVLYVVSAEEPDLTHLVEQAGWPALPERWATRPYGPFLDSLSEGQRWAFRLTANPTHAVRVDEQKKRSQRLGHVTVAQQVQWLVERADSRGFSLPPSTADGSVTVDGVDGEAATPLVVRRRQARSFGRRHQSGGQQRSQVTLTTAVYDGHLVVKDAALLRDALTRGIGPAKAYGCGLMTLARPRGQR